MSLVNGFQIDLNQAARQEIFRLPNGKLIQVRKQPNSTNSAPTMRPGLHLMSRPHMPVRPSPPNITTTSRMIRPQVAPQLRIARPQVPQQRPPAPSTSTSSAPGTVASTVFTQQNGSISVARAPQPDTPYGKAKTAFEDKIINGLEICQHTINKMITLTNSSSFKNSRSFADLKELYIHLQYLFTYTSGKIKTLQDSLATNVEELAKHDKSLKEKEKHEDDELEIVEQKQDVIEVLSDDDGETYTPKTVATKRTAEPFPRKSLTEKQIPEQDFDQEIISAIVATMQNTFARQPDQIELLASCNYISDDKKLLTKSAVKVERLEDAKSPIIKQYMIAIQQRRDREVSEVQNAEENDENGDEEDDYQPLVPEIVMDENPNPEQSNNEDEIEANNEEKVAEDSETTENSANKSSDVVEIASDDETENVEKKTEEVENKEEENVENMETNENENEKPEESTTDLMDVSESKPEENIENENGDDSALACEEVLESNETNDITENGSEEITENSTVENNAEDITTENISDDIQTGNIAENNEIKDSEDSIVKSTENNEEISKMSENGIDEKDLLDNLINSLDETEPLAPIELENFP